MTDPYIQRIEKFLETHGIETYRFVRRAKHRAVVVEHRGERHTVFFPTTGSDWRCRYGIKRFQTFRSATRASTFRTADTTYSETYHFPWSVLARGMQESSTQTRTSRT